MEKLKGKFFPKKMYALLHKKKKHKRCSFGLLSIKIVSFMENGILCFIRNMFFFMFFMLYSMESNCVTMLQTTNNEILVYIPSECTRSIVVSFISFLSLSWSLS